MKQELSNRRLLREDATPLGWHSVHHFKTNQNADTNEDWIIANAIKVVKVLNDDEVSDIATEHGLKAQYRWKADGTDKNKFLADFNQFSSTDNMFESIYNSRFC